MNKIMKERTTKPFKTKFLLLTIYSSMCQSNQNKEIEVKEENLLMDLYFNTLQNSHIFEQTEHKFEVK